MKLIWLLLACCLILAGCAPAAPADQPTDTESWWRQDVIHVGYQVGGLRRVIDYELRIVCYSQRGSSYSPAPSLFCLPLPDYTPIVEIK